MKLWIWERPARIHTIYTAALGAMYPLKKEFGECYADYLYGFFKGGMVRWVCDIVQLQNNGINIIPRFIDKKEYDKINIRWKKLCRKINSSISSIKKLELKQFSDTKLLELYDRFDDTYLEWWGFGQVAELIGYGGEKILKESLTKEQENRYFSTLVTPTKKSNSNKEEEHLFNISKIAAKKGINSKEVEKMLEEHSFKYYWLHNNFFNTEELDARHFKKEIKNHLKNNVDFDEIIRNNNRRLNHIKIQKERIMDTIDVPIMIRKIVYLLDDFCYFQDLRKAIDMRCNGILDCFCKEVSKRKKIDYDLLSFCLPDQFRAILRGKNISLETIRNQKKRCVIIFNDYEYESEIITGDRSIEKEKEVFGDLTQGEKSTELLGLCASTGRFKGRVRIITKIKDIPKMKRGEILVSTMTTPNFLPAMKIAGGIITDEGGVTSHASIVSRELGIPCVIATGNATRVLKDGDLVELRANHGLVKIINKKNNI